MYDLPDSSIDNKYVCWQIRFFSHVTTLNTRATTYSRTLVMNFSRFNSLNETNKFSTQAQMEVSVCSHPRHLALYVEQSQQSSYFVGVARSSHAVLYPYTHEFTGYVHALSLLKRRRRRRSERHCRTSPLALTMRVNDVLFYRIFYCTHTQTNIRICNKQFREGNWNKITK